MFLYLKLSFCYFFDKIKIQLKKNNKIKPTHIYVSQSSSGSIRNERIYTETYNFDNNDSCNNITSDDDNI